MGKTGKWIKNFLTGRKKDHKDKEGNNGSSHPSIITEKPATPVVIPSATPKEKKRWSFRRSSATAPTLKHSTADSNQTRRMASLEPEIDQKKHALAVAAATAGAADAVVRLTPTGNTSEKTSTEEEVAAIKIQSMYRSYLARKALKALRGLVKLQALVRGHLVRKQATATLRCMQALVTVQTRARAERIRSAEESKQITHCQSAHRRNSQDFKYRHLYHDTEKGMEENIKIVEMDIGKSKSSSKTSSSYSNYQHNDRADHRFPPYYPPKYDYLIPDYQKISPAPSAITDISPRTCSGHFEDYPFATAQSSPHCCSAVSRPDPSRTFAFPHPENVESLSYDYPLYPNYMANTQSSRAKARSQSAPKHRPDMFERQPSKRRPSVEGRNIPRAFRMQRSSSHVGSTAQNYQYPWAIKLDKSTVSLMDSECGSTRSALTNTNYCRSVASYDPHGNRY